MLQKTVKRLVSLLRKINEYCFAVLLFSTSPAAYCHSIVAAERCSSAAEEPAVTVSNLVTVVTVSNLVTVVTVSNSSNS